MTTLTKSTGTVALSGAVEKITFPAAYGWVWVKNMSDADMFVGLSDGVSAGADGVLAISAGECGRIQTDGQDSVYLMGSGNALVVAQNYADCPFKVGGKGGEIPDLSAYAKKTDIPTKLPADGGNADTVGGLRADEIANNPNLLINPDFKINQRGVSATFSETGKYFVDRWRLVSGTVTVNADSTLTLNGTISQIFENAVGDNVTSSVSAGTAVYDNSTKTFSITANGDIISWAKLEYGSIATAFVVPDPATELMKCMRYYEIIMAAGCDRGLTAELFPGNVACVEIIFKTAKRVVPTLTTTQMRFVVATPTGYHAIVVAAIHQYVAGTDIFGMNIATDEPLFTDLPSNLFGVTADTAGAALAVDAEIY